MLCQHCINEIPDGSLFCNHCSMPTQATPKPKGRSPLLWLAMGIIGLLFIVWYVGGSWTSNRIIAAATHTPITMTDETQNLSANSWRSIPVFLPYGGSLDITLNIIRGNPLDVLLVNSSEMDIVKETPDWRPIRGNTEFSAVKTMTYHRTSPILKGNYFLVLRDTSLGILSQRSSDVEIKITLKP